MWYPAPAPYSRYEISEQGQIRNSQGHILQGSHSSGYIRVRLRLDTGGDRTLLLHRIIAEVFFGPPSVGYIAHHINGDTLDNRRENLKWVTQKQNVQLMQRTPNSKARPILQLTLNRDLIRRWDRLKDVPYNRSLIWKVCNKKGTTAYGFLWEYDDENIEGELWTTISFEGRPLKVSDQGRIQLPSGKISKGSPNRSGYCVVRPFNSKSIVVHRLIAMAFLPAPKDPSKATVNHKNFNKSDNCASNLEWVTQSENNFHAQKNRSSHKVIKCPVIQHTPNGDTHWFPSIEAASIATNTAKSNICMVCKGVRKSANKCHWAYSDEELPD